MMRLLFRLSLTSFILSTILTVLSLFAGRTLHYTGDFAYMSDRSGTNKLYLMDVQRQFTFHIDRLFINDCCLTWSPDGQSLAFVVDTSESASSILKANFHSPLQYLTKTPGFNLYPTYSPDSQQIAYTSFGYGNSELYLMNADGSQPRVLTGEKHITNLNPRPVWSVDGQSILFSDFDNPNSLLAVPKDCSDPCEDAIHTVFDTNGLPLMTTSFVPLDPYRLFMAALERTQQGGYAMYGLDSRSSQHPERLTINAGLDTPSIAVHDHWIAFVSGNTDLQQPVEDANLYVMDTNCIGSEKGCSGTIQKVASSLRTEDNISWSADGRWLAFVTVDGRLSHLNFLDTTCVYQQIDCARSIYPQPVTSARYIRPAWRPFIR
jgi:Tol biopolymer transport system component